MKIFKHSCLLRLLIVVLSLGLGFASYYCATLTGNIGDDFVWAHAGTLLPLLLTLLVLSTTLGMNLLKEIRTLINLVDQDKFNSAIDSIKFNFLEGVITFLFAFVVLVMRPLLGELQQECIVRFLCVLVDSFFVYCLLLFLWIISDAADALIDIYKFNFKD